MPIPWNKGVPCLEGTKQCVKCKVIKSAEEFQKDKRKTSGLHAWCKSCVKEYNRKRYINNREKQNEQCKQWRINNPGYKPKNLEKIREYNRRWRINNPEYDKQYFKNNPDKMKEKDRKRRLNPHYKLSEAISIGMNRSLKYGKGNKHWETLVRYSLNDLVSHLEKQFQTGMSWKNYGFFGWHVDHIIPKSFFEFTSPKDVEFKYCWSLDNLQPLWAKDNLSKGNRLSA